MKTKIHFVWTGMICLMIVTGFLALFVPGNACAGSTKQELVFLTWSEYMDPDIIKEFEEKFKAKVKNIYFETEDKREQLLAQTMGKGYDVVLASGVNTLSYIRRNWLVPLNSDQIPNLKHIDPKWFSVNPKITAYGVPYLWGTLGIAYRKDFIKEKVTSWKQLLEPDKKLHGKILMINDARDAIGMALKYLGYSMNSTNPEALARAEALLLAQKPFVKNYGYLALTEDSGLLTGDYLMVMLYNGDALALQEINSQISFSVPMEGTNIWMDYLMVMEASKKKELAMSFINFINEPENAARLALYVNFASPNMAAKKLLPQDHLDDPIIYPNKDVLDRSEFANELPPRVQKKYNTIFSKILHGL